MEDVDQVESRETEALRKVKIYSGWAAGSGLVPIPVLDLAAISGIQLKMIHAISTIYGVPFARGAAKSIIGALVGGGGAVAVAGPAGSIIKAVPVVGQLVGVLTQPALAAATTYALGRVFIQHFETGGNLLNFNAADLRRYYEEQFAAAREPRPRTSGKAAD